MAGTDRSHEERESGEGRRQATQWNGAGQRRSGGRASATSTAASRLTGRPLLPLHCFLRRFRAPSLTWPLGSDDSSSPSASAAMSRRAAISPSLSELSEEAPDRRMTRLRTSSVRTPATDTAGEAPRSSMSLARCSILARRAISSSLCVPSLLPCGSSAVSTTASTRSLRRSSSGSSAGGAGVGGTGGAGGGVRGGRRGGPV